MSRLLLGEIDLKICVLGAGGFLGSHLVEHLTTLGQHEVVGVDRNDEKLAHIDRRLFDFRLADALRDESAVDAAVDAADVVVDLVAHANPSLYISAPLDVFETNFQLNLRIVERCVEQGKRLIQYSSAEVYGKSLEGLAYNEDASDFVLGPVQKSRWIYSAAKSLLERVIYAYGEAGKLDFVIIRPFNCVGPRLDYLVPAGFIGGPRVVPHFISALTSGGPIRLVNGGNAHRAFMHIEDANRAFQAVLDDKEGSHNQIFNMGNPENNLTIRELALLMMSLFKELTGQEPASELVEVSGEEFYGVGYEDSDRLPPDISKLAKLGWRPRHDIHRTLVDTMQYFLDRRGIGRLDGRVAFSPRSAAS